MNIDKFKKNMIKNYGVENVKKASYHIYEVDVKYLKPYQLKVLYDYLQRHKDLYP